MSAPKKKAKNAAGKAKPQAKKKNGKSAKQPKFTLLKAQSAKDFDLPADITTKISAEIEDLTTQAQKLDGSDSAAAGQCRDAARALNTLNNEILEARLAANNDDWQAAVGELTSAADSAKAALDSIKKIESTVASIAKALTLVEKVIAAAAAA